MWCTDDLIETHQRVVGRRRLLGKDVDGSAGDVTMDLSEDGADVLVMIGGEVVAVLEGGVGADLTDIYVEVSPDVFPTGGATAA